MQIRIANIICHHKIRIESLRKDLKKQDYKNLTLDKTESMQIINISRTLRKNCCLQPKKKKMEKIKQRDLQLISIEALMYSAFREGYGSGVGN